MSECNYCGLERMKERCKREGKKIELKTPKDKEMRSLMHYAVVVDGEEVAWFMELTDHCCC